LALADTGTPTASQAPNMMAEAEWLIGIRPSLSLMQMEPKSNPDCCERGASESSADKTDEIVSLDRVSRHLLPQETGRACT
jgi:hypothetical protein